MEEQENKTPESTDVERPEESVELEKQKKLVAHLRAQAEKEEATEPSLELLRESDLLRHMIQKAKGSPRERAASKAEYAAKAANRRAIQPVEE